MRIFLCECKKLLAFRPLWILLVCLIAVNCYVQISGTKDRYYTPESYRAFFADIADMTEEEKLAYPEQMLNKQDAGSRTPYPSILLYDMAEIAQQLADYPNYLTGIHEQAETMTTISIWGGKDTFSYRNIQKTPPAYKAMAGTELELAPSLGLEDAMIHPVSDFIGIFLVFLVVSTVMLKDREQGILPLIYAMKFGRQRLMLTKTAAASVFSAGICVLLFLCNLIIGSALYGLGDLSRPIQSVYGFISCNLPLSVGQYLLLFLLNKIGAYLVFVVLFVLFCVISRNNLMAYGLSGGMCAAAFLLYRFIPSNSPWSILHFINPVQFTQCSEICGTYQNINLFGWPISLKWSVLIVTLVVLIFGSWGAALLFARQRNMQYRRITLRIFHWNRFRVHSKFFYTCYKSLVLHKGIVLFLAVICASFALSAGFIRSYDNDDIYYESFTTEWEGEITDETLAFLSEKETHYAEVEQQIAQIQLEDPNNTYELNSLQNELNDRTAFERLNNRVKAIQKSGKEVEIFYDTGYERLVSADGNHEDLVIVLVTLVFLSLLLSPIGASDNKNDMVKVLFSTRSGEKGYLRSHLIYSALCGIFASLLLSLPYLFHVLHSYGMQGLSAPIQSITAFASSILPISVGGEILLLLLIRTTSAAITAMLIFCVSAVCRSSTTAYVINLSLFVLPVVLVLLGIPVFGKIGFVPFLSGNRLFISA